VGGFCRADIVLLPFVNGGVEARAKQGTLF
jgi:hypothetical protein